MVSGQLYSLKIYGELKKAFAYCVLLTCLVVSDSLRPHGLVAHQVPLSMRFSRKEYWSGLPFPSPSDFPNPGTESRSPTLQADSLSIK